VDYVKYDFLAELLKLSRFFDIRFYIFVKFKEWE